MMNIVFQALHPNELIVNGEPVAVSLVGTNLNAEEITAAKALGVAVTEYPKPTPFAIDTVTSVHEDSIRSLILVEDPVTAAKMHDARDDLFTAAHEGPDGEHAITVDGSTVARAFRSQAAAATAAQQLHRRGVQATVVSL